MADPIDAASSAAEDQKRQALAAVAAGGQAALGALQQGQQQVGALRDAALKSALAQAVSRGAPASAQAVLGSTVSDPYGRVSADMAQGAASRKGDFAMLGAGAGNYFNQLQASVPFVRQQAQQAAKAQGLQLEIERLRQDREDKRQERDYQLRVQEAAARQPSAVQQASKEFGGMTGLRSYLQQGGSDYVNLERGAVNPTTSPKGEDKRSMTDAELRSQGLEVVGQDLGLPPGVSGALAPAPKAAKPAAAHDPVARRLKITDDRIGVARKSSTYKSLLALIKSEQNAGATSAEIRQKVRTSPNYTKTPLTAEVTLADAL